MILSSGVGGPAGSFCTRTCASVAVTRSSGHALSFANSLRAASAATANAASPLAALPKAHAKSL